MVLTNMSLDEDIYPNNALQDHHQDFMEIPPFVFAMKQNGDSG